MVEIKNATGRNPLRLQQWMTWPLVELAIVFTAGVVVLLTGLTLFGNGVVATVASVWAANVLMLGLIQLGLRARGQGWDHLGLTFSRPWGALVVRVFLQSIAVCVCAVIAFVLGAILMVNLVGMPEPADMSRYNYLQGNLGLTLLALASIYFISSFAEEVIYRGFLITRIEECLANTRAATLIAIIASSSVFGLVHSDWGIAGMVQATCMGLALGAAFHITGRNLWITVLAHAYMDTLLVVQMYVG